VSVSDHHTAALARWFAQGVSSETHPVLQFAFATFFQPLGIEAASLEAEPFSGLESATGSWWLNQPRWNAGKVVRAGPFSGDFGGLLEFQASFRVSVAPSGWISIAPTLQAENDLAAQAYWASSDHGWLAARHSFEATRHTEVFLYAAAALLLDDALAAQLYCLGEYAAFCARILQRLAFTPSLAPSSVQ